MHRSILLRYALVIVALVAAMLGCYPDPPAPEAPPSEGVVWPEHFPPQRLSDDLVPTEARIALGKRLFFDPRLSRDGSVSCASCHKPELAFTDGRALSIGIDGRIVPRNSPTLANAAWSTSQFWDGGVPSLELQVIAPIENPLEMDNTLANAISTVAADPSYVSQFQQAYGRNPDAYSFTRAIAAFERSLISADAPYDRFITGREPGALSASARRGMELFFGEKAECFHCHGSNLTSDFTFENNGLYLNYADEGRARITQRSDDIGRFKVPSLRNVELTAPYMHDGSIASLEAVIAHYESGGKGHPNQAPFVRPFSLSSQERADLLAFLRALTDRRFLDNPAHRP